MSPGELTSRAVLNNLLLVGVEGVAVLDVLPGYSFRFGKMAAPRNEVAMTNGC